MTNRRATHSSKITSSTRNIFAFWIIASFIVGTIFGFAALKLQRPFSDDYLVQSTSIMKTNGSNMMQMGQMMMEMGKMMEQKGGKYGDNDLEIKGKDLDEKGFIMRKDGSEMMEKAAGMMQMMEK